MKKTLLIVLAIAFTTTLQAQKVVGYIDANLNQTGDRLKKIHWENLTDFIFGFIQPDGNGNLPDPTTILHFNTALNYCNQNGVDMHFSSGGATQSAVFNTIGSSQTSIDNYAKEIADILQTHGLTGWDLDWEFPRTAGEQVTQVKILKAVHDEFVSRGKRDEWKIAIAVGGETPSVGAQSVYHTDYCSVDAFQYLDYLNVMSYDIGYNISGSDFNHSSYADAQANVNDWVAKGCPMEKIVLGVPFYGRHKTSRYAGVYGTVYSELSDADPAAAYNSNNVGDYYYNGAPLLEQKTEYIMDAGGAGIMIWEITYDRFDQYSLLDAIAGAMAPYQCSAEQPDLGSDMTICGSSSVTLNSGVNTSAGRTFTWKRGNTTLVNANASENTHTVSQAGTYTVSVNEDGCSNSDEIEVLGNLPSIDFGGDQELCKPSMITLDAGVSGNVEYTWEKDGSLLPESGESLDVHLAGIYKLTVSDAAGVCNDVSDQVTITSSLIDATGASICTPGTVNLTINENEGNYSWFTTLENGSAVATGQSYAPTISQSTFYYVEVEVTGGENCVGLVEWTGQTAAGTYIYEGQKWRANWYINTGQTPTNHTETGLWTNLGSCSGVALCDRTPVLAELAVCNGLSDGLVSSFEINPNPASTYLHINAKGKKGTAVISNMKGQPVLTESLSDNANLDISALNNGVYLIQVITESTNETVRFIKQ